MVNHPARNPQTRMISPTKRIQVVYRMRPGDDMLFQRVIDLPDHIETAGVDFAADANFRQRVTAAFRALIVGDVEAANRSLDDPDYWPLKTHGDEADRYEIVAVFGLGARPKALF